MASKKHQLSVKTFKRVSFSLNFWVYEKLKDYANQNGLSVVGALRMIVNQFFKNTNTL